MATPKSPEDVPAVVNGDHFVIGDPVSTPNPAPARDIAPKGRPGRREPVVPASERDGGEIGYGC